MPGDTGCGVRCRERPEWSGGRRLLRRRQRVAVLLEHPDPARGVALDHECLVVRLGIVVRLVRAQHPICDAQHLVRRGDGGPLVTPTYGQGLVVSPELAMAGPRGTVSAFGQDRAQGGVALATPRYAPLACTLVVAGTQARPGCAVTGRREDRDVGTELDQHGRGGVHIDTGQSGQEIDLGTVLGQTSGDDGIVLGDPAISPVEGHEVILKQEVLPWGEIVAQGVVKYLVVLPDVI